MQGRCHLQRATSAWRGGARESAIKNVASGASAVSLIKYLNDQVQNATIKYAVYFLEENNLNAFFEYRFCFNVRRIYHFTFSSRSDSMIYEYLCVKVDGLPLGIIQDCRAVLLIVIHM